MKKYFVFFVLLLCSFIVHSQERYTFSKIIQADSLNKKELFSISKMWFNETFRAGTTVNNRSEDFDAGIFIDKCLMPYFYEKNNTLLTMTSRCIGNIYYTIKIETKDGRLKITFFDYYHEGIEYNLGYGLKTRYSLEYIDKSDGNPEWPNYKKKCWVDAKKQIEENFNETVSNLEKTIKNFKNDKDNW